MRRPNGQNYAPDHRKQKQEIEDNCDNQPSAPNEDLALFNVGAEARQPMKVEVRVGDSLLIMEVDTGAAVSIISQQEYKSKFSQYKLHKSDVILKTYTSEMMKVVGEITVNVNTSIKSRTGPSSCRRSWTSSTRTKLVECSHSKLALKYCIHPSSVE